MGKEEFWKVDYTYVLYSSYLCEKFNIPHFSLVSSKSAAANSMFYYFEVKGKIEDALKILQIERKIESLSIFQPGVITDRDNDKRCGESLICCFPCISKIKSADLGRGIVNESERLHKDYIIYGKQSITYDNNELLNLSVLNI